MTPDSIYTPHNTVYSIDVPANATLRNISNSTFSINFRNILFQRLTRSLENARLYIGIYTSNIRREIEAAVRDRYRLFHMRILAKISTALAFRFCHKQDTHIVSFT